MARKTKQVAEICLYGSCHLSKTPGGPPIGAGWLAQLADGRLLGDGEPRSHLSMTDAVLLACEAIRGAGCQAGTVRVFMAGGRLMADTRVGRPGYFGELKWTTATAYVIDAAAIEAAAEPR